MQQIKRGSRGELVALVQLMLNEKGYSCGKRTAYSGQRRRAR